MKMNEFIGQLFLARDVAHSVHLNTRSYAKHVALQEFYENILGLADTLAEAYQGRHGLIGTITLAAVKKEVKIVEFLQAQLAELEEARYDVVDKSDSALQQLIDNVVEQYLKTLYKLRFLA
jgi:DNA-binding ferritin-like protein